MHQFQSPPHDSCCKDASRPQHLKCENTGVKRDFQHPAGRGTDALDFQTDKHPNSTLLNSPHHFQQLLLSRQVKLSNTP